MSLLKPLKETEFDSEKGAELFRHRTRRSSLRHLPLKDCEQGFWNTGVESKIGMWLE